MDWPPLLSSKTEYYPHLLSSTLPNYGLSKGLGYGEAPSLKLFVEKSKKIRSRLKINTIDEMPRLASINFVLAYIYIPGSFLS